MRLYTRTGATALDDPEYGHFDADDDGCFELPDDLAERLHGFARGGQPMWETDIERNNRLINEELERRKDPATLLDAVQQILNAAKAAKTEPDPESKSAPAKRAAKKTTASKSDSE